MSFFKAITIWFVAFACAAIHGAQRATVEEVPAPTIVLSSEIDTTWRYTRDGWKDTSRWTAGTFVHGLNPIAKMHPVTVAGLMLLAVVIVTLWSSNEWEIARVVHLFSWSGKPFVDD